jgi:phospholipid/cholesterol/gamma-HCH transport system substrate-binding protein
MSREIKIGILAIVSLFGAIWGYKFVKGQDLFQKSTLFYTSYGDVTGLEVSSPVTINGYKVGTVESIKINAEDVKKMDVIIRVDGDFKIPKDAQVLLKSEGLVGGKFLAISYAKPCKNNCAKEGDYLIGKDLGLIGSLVSQDEVGGYTSTIAKEISASVQKLGAEGEPGKINEIVRQLEIMSINLNAVTLNLNKMLVANNNNIASITSNINKITSNLAANNNQINDLIANLSRTTKSLSDANLGNTVSKTNLLLDNSTETVKKLQTTLESANGTLSEFKSIANKIESGDGSLSKLISDKKLYDNLELTSRNLALLLQDLRLNPKRYVSVSVFGKKSKDYTLPENDPAFPKEEK